MMGLGRENSSHSTQLSESQAPLELSQALKDLLLTFDEKCRSECDETVHQVNSRFDNVPIHLLAYMQKAYTFREKLVISKLNDYKRKHEELSAASSAAYRKMKQSVDKYRNLQTTYQDELDRNYEEMVREFVQFETDMEDAATRIANDRNTVIAKMEREIHRFRELEARLGPEEKGQNQDELLMSFKALLRKVG
ncbi:hypothetical protein SeMB42_g03171 [Synchytrium endobioticum]|uniref:Transforming acidic coiled-coil-containing protein C-terminal domain-containing protein n=1 Tax=Synchytrium endobioticum TaxID=286115 RepID=A0A507D8S1_9FUNG|nr:hypothetical protein SeLEV6574_g04110 [Synchytrium endobioticum]TPX47831.1 hypothetical protein SeMB42_g03171 [Synchytrium endobioticum]